MKVSEEEVMKAFVRYRQLSMVGLRCEIVKRRLGRDTLDEESAVLFESVDFPTRHAVWALIDKGLLDFNPLRDVVRVG